MPEQTMVVSTPTEVNAADPIKPTVPDISLDPLDFQKEIAKIAAEQGQKIDNGNVVPVENGSQELAAGPKAASQPVPPQAVAQPEVPAKFQTQEGQVDLSKVEKSTINAEEALRKYSALEAELKSKMNVVRDLKAQEQPPQQHQAIPPPYPLPYPSPYPQGSLTPEQINRDLETRKNPGETILEVGRLAAQEGYQRAKQELETRLALVQDRLEAQNRALELQKIADRDPWVFSDEGIKALGQIRQNKPWLNGAPEPWLEAYKSYKADQSINGPASQVTMPNPTAQTVRAPATPVQAGTRVQTQTVSLSQLSQDPKALNQFLDSLTPDQQKSFWRSALPGAK